MPATPRGMPIINLINALLVLGKHCPAATVCVVGGDLEPALVVSYNHQRPLDLDRFENAALVKAEMQLKDEQAEWAVQP